jgi:hypothetical protein
MLCQIGQIGLRKHYASEQQNSCSSKDEHLFTKIGFGYFQNVSPCRILGRENPSDTFKFKRFSNFLLKEILMVIRDDDQIYI